MSWEERMAQRHVDEVKGNPPPYVMDTDGNWKRYDEKDYAWDPQPPATDLCLKCFEWRQYPTGQKHFGYAWWRTCSHDCNHEHHKYEVWMA